MFVGVPALRGPVKEAKKDLAEKKEAATYESIAQWIATRSRAHSAGGSVANPISIVETSPPKKPRIEVEEVEEELKEKVKVLEEAAVASAAREKLLLDGALRLEREKAETARQLTESQKAEEAQKGLAHATEEKYKKSVEELKEQLENVQQAKLCNICWEEEKRVALQPCGHVCICTKCSTSANLQACPLCRTEIKGRFPVFV